MDAHAALKLGDRRARIDGIDERLHRLVAARAEERRAEDAPALLLDVNLEKALRLALFDRPRDARHWPLADARPQAGFTDLRFAHSDAPERRIGIESIDRDAIGPFAPGAREQVVRHDLVIVVRGMGEGALAVAVAERPYVRIAGAKAFVDLDIAALVLGDPGALEAEIVGVRHAADCEQQVRAAHARFTFLALEADRNAVSFAREAQAFGARAHGDAFGLEDFPDRLRHVLVLARDQPRRHLDDRHARAEAAVHLAELEADVAAADDDEVLRHEVDVHERLVGEVGHLVDALILRHERPPADIQKDFVRFEVIVLHLDRLRPRETGMTLEARRALQPAHPLL